MMNSAAAIAETPTPPSTAASAHKGRAREEKSAKRVSAKPKANALERYFVANGSGEAVTMGRELASEQEALVAAFQEKATFFVVTEYRVDTQFKGGNALLVKEGVSRADR
jgi:hypothetical protein